MGGSNYKLETHISGALIGAYGTMALEPITRNNLCELRPGEWIWDDKLTERRVHRCTLGNEVVQEPIGFRQIQILDLDLYPRWSSKPFRLSDVDGSTHDARSGWTYFEEGRFFRLVGKD